jgi:hypothetical protein
VYASSTCDPSGHGEGEATLGLGSASTDSAGNATFELVFGAALAAGQAVTATAWNVTTGDSSEFSACVTAVACAGTDADCDGYEDNVVLAHPGPSNTDTTRDNCIGLTNNLQLNADGNFVDMTPPKSSDDRTWVNSDGVGDACDSDDDNDGILDFYEPVGFCSGFTLDPLQRDTDLDRYVDNAECSIGTDPTSSASRPTTAQCVTASGAASTSTDTDSDGVKDHTEYCQYGSDPANDNTDGDACTDGRETGNVDGNQTINGADLGVIASAVPLGAYPTPYSGSEWRWDTDVDKNGTVNAADLGLAASKFGACP